MKEYEYHFYNGEGEPPYVETKWFLTRPGSTLIFEGKEYEVKCWMLKAGLDDDMFAEPDDSPIIAVCDLIGTFDEDAVILSMKREDKLAQIGI